MGERGSVRELWDFGERILLGCVLAVRDATRVPPPVAVFVRLEFFGLQSWSGWAAGSFSLSDRMSMSELRLFAPLLGVEQVSHFCSITAKEFVPATEGSACFFSTAGTFGSGLAADTFGSTSVAGTFGKTLVESTVWGIFFGTGTSVYFSKISPMLAFLKLTGIRLMRRSIRDRKSVA